MSKPMTTKEAHKEYLCDVCMSGGDCGYNCVESATCSIACDHCFERVWFQGDTWRIPEYFTCPYCGKNAFNSQYKYFKKFRRDE